MDQRQRKTREALYAAFKELLAEKDYAKISVADIIERAGVGRTTFYAHFSTKDALLDDVCCTIFEHVFNTPEAPEPGHDYSQGPCDLHAEVAHLLHHIAENDMGVADLICGKSSDVVMARFQRHLYDLASAQIERGELAVELSGDLPRRFLAHHFAVSLIGAIHGWVMRGMQEEPDTVAGYFVRVMTAGA